MSVPKQRHTKGRRDRRRVRFTIKSKNLVTCSHCKKMTKSHEACAYCGYYKGKEVFVVKKKKAKKKK